MKGGRWRESMMNLFEVMYTDRIALGIGPFGGSGVLIGVISGMEGVRLKNLDWRRTCNDD
jgi:hypothetical protein